MENDHQEPDWSDIALQLESLYHQLDDAPANHIPLRPTGVERLMAFHYLLRSIFEFQNESDPESTLPTERITAEYLKSHIDFLLQSRLPAAKRMRDTYRAVLDIINLSQLDDVESRTEALKMVATTRSGRAERQKLLCGEIELLQRHVEQGTLPVDLRIMIRCVEAAEDLGLIHLLARILIINGKLHLMFNRCDKRSHVVEAVFCFEQACRTLENIRISKTLGDYSASLDADAYQHLGLATFLKQTGDHTGNLLLCLRYHIRALRLLLEMTASETDRRRRLSIIAGNLINVIRSFVLPENEHQVAKGMIRIVSLKLCIAALHTRNIKSNAEDYAKIASSVNSVLLDPELQDEAALTGRTLAKEIAARVISHRADIRDQTLVGLAHKVLAEITWNEFVIKTAEEHLTVSDNPFLADDIMSVSEMSTPRRSCLDEAAQHARSALDNMHQGQLQGHGDNIMIRHGDDMIFMLVKINEQLNDHEATLQMLKVHRLNDLDAMPLSRQIQYHSSIGWAHAARDQWGDSLMAYLAAVRSVKSRYQDATDAVKADLLYPQYDRLWRWASMAAAKAGDTRQAVIWLEVGRKIELLSRLMLQDGSSQSSLSPAANAFVEDMCKDKPRFDVDFDDLLGATTPDWPVVYINPTPFGTMILALTNSGHTNCLCTSDFTAAEAFRASIHCLPKAEGWNAASQNLESSLLIIGKQLGPKIIELVENLQGIPDERVEGITIIQFGFSAAIPFSCLKWLGPSGYRYLVDHLPIRYAPSAFGMARSLETAATVDKLLAHHKPFLLALDLSGSETSSVRFRLRDYVFNAPWGDSEDTPSLHAGFSVRTTEDYEIRPFQRLFRNTRRKRVSIGRNAFYDPKMWKWATHLYLRSHDRNDGNTGGRSGLRLLNQLVAAVGTNKDWALGDGQSSHRSLLRAVMATSCDSAAPWHDLPNGPLSFPDDSLYFPVALLVAGVPLVVAATWKLHDVPNALLATRFLEIHLKGHETVNPAVALREAQLWLRHLPRQSYTDSFFARHQDLLQLYEVFLSRSICDLEFPFEDPIFWGSWMCFGA